MVTLVLVRHAKSDWGDRDLDDHDRPLNDRGRHDAPRMAEALAASGPTPELIVSSTALRARTTAQAFADASGAPLRLDESLYAAPADALLAAAVESEVETVMVVAHNPGITYLASRLSDRGIAHMPTCAVAVFEWRDAGWDAAASGSADAWRLDTPRDSSD